ncbi:YopX family protein [Capnocytophaga canis]|uniref:YopX protein domain-containing protein n=1 Tax=Capnocytophaga canis TaxID=1848903 RepID=A0A0B7IUW8_9FLAO|nr:YopX family protein [Capnocytophaga canis]CEN54444.1 conserved hypothetical protein [Capnocytophaga canis]
MKRAIKFRAFVKLEELNLKLIPFFIEGKTIYDVKSIDFNQKEITVMGICLISVDFNAIELMQFTGLYDKNGKEIYEGDVIPIFGKNHAVKFNYGMFTINDREMRRYIHSIPLEVIGNVYENPELVK